MQFAQLTHVSTETDPAGASLLSFRAARPFAHKPGQFGLWIVGGSARPFTIASAPGEEFIQLGTRLHTESRIKRALAGLQPGDTVRLLGPLGKMTPPGDGTPLVYVAQGIGITPARALIKAEPARPQTLIHVGAPCFRGELEPAVDQAVYLERRSGLAEALAEVAENAGDSHFLVAGSSPFVRETAALLRQQGVDGRRIHADSFLGLPD